MIVSVAVHHGDSRDVLKSLADASIDSCVTDPPYALVSIGKRFGKEGAAPAKSEGASGVYRRASAGFMGQQWDTGETAFDPDFWREVYRVLKPGAHVVAFSATRTYHRLACAIEDAGFEIRDMVAWLYGSGFPKSHDVAKGIQKRRTEDEGAVRAVCRAIRARMDAAGLKSRDLTALFGDCHPRLIDHWAARDTDSQPSLPTWDQWGVLRERLGLGDALDAEVWRLNGRKGSPGEAWTGAEVIGLHEGATPGLVGMRFSDADRSIRRASDEAAAWGGWGTALKPALEPIVFARKPLDGTVASNVLKHGPGALNIDGCRVRFFGEEDEAESKGKNRHADFGSGARENAVYGADPRPRGANGYYDPPGRWPANVVHDGSTEVLDGFPESEDGVAGARTGVAHITLGGLGPQDAWGGYGGGGSAARFFYSAKADAEDRLGSKHPTVKPIDLMAWLCRLVTPPGGLVLDPFAGTGTTGLAARREGFSAILIEREGQYVADINRRLAWARGEGRLTAQETARAEPKSVDDLPLFGGEAA